MLHNTLTIRVIIMEKNHQWKMIKLKLLVQGVNLIKTFHQLENTLLYHKHVSNKPIKYIYHAFIFYWFFFTLFIINIYRASIIPS